MPARKKQSKLKRFAKALVPNTKLKQLVTFILVFGAVGGGYFLYRSFALTPWEYFLQASSCPNYGGQPAKLSAPPAGTAYNNWSSCTKAVDKFLGKYAGLYWAEHQDYNISLDQNIRAWQRGANLTADGVVGPMTWLTMAAAVNAPTNYYVPPGYSYLGQFENQVRMWGCQNYTSAFGGVYNFKLQFIKAAGASLGPRYGYWIENNRTQKDNKSSNTYYYGTAGSLEGSLSILQGDWITVEGYGSNFKGADGREKINFATNEVRYWTTCR